MCAATYVVHTYNRVFDVYLSEKLSHIADSSIGLVLGALYGVMGDNFTSGARKSMMSLIMRLLLAFVCLVFQILMLVILLCPLAAIYVCGLLMSTGISIWRLIQHDYGGNSDGGANLKPAMDTLYSLALLQGLLFCYRFFFDLRKASFVKEVIPEPYDKEEFKVVSMYLRETRIRCEKDPSFVRGRNLITHSVDLIGSKSRDDCLSGVKMLYSAICIGERRLNKARVEDPNKYYFLKESIKHECRTTWEEIIGKHMLMRHLIVYAAPSSPVLQKLLELLDPHGACDREMRNRAARIVAHLALDIHLKQFPQAIMHISTLIGMTFEEYCLMEPYNVERLLHKYDQNRDWKASCRLPSPDNDTTNLLEAYEKLVLRGLCILRKLATNEDNCRIISHTQGLLPRIMAPLTSDIIHRFSGGAWSISVVEGSLKAMGLLVVSSGETGAKLRREICSNKEAIGTIERILRCDTCCAKLQKRAMEILMQLYVDNQEKREACIKMLVDIFAGDSKHKSIRKLAGKALAKLCMQDGSNTRIILQVNGDVLGRLNKILLVDDAENKKYRISAAEILEQMCVHHNQDNECLSELKKAMADTNTMPKVLAQILSRGPTEDETHVTTEEDQVKVIQKKVDIENQCDENGRDKTSSSTLPQNIEDYEYDVPAEVEEDESENDEDEDLHAPLLSLCVAICDTLISADQDLACQFGEISLPSKLKDMVAENSVPTTRCLRLMKLTCKMVISMMKHRGSYRKEELESLTQALSIASETERMSHLDISMVFASEDDGSATAVKPVRSLGSLVKEAKESVDAYFKPQDM